MPSRQILSAQTTVRFSTYCPCPVLSSLSDVYFERSTNDFSNDAVARSTAAKLKLESFYKVAVDAAIERNARHVNAPLFPSSSQLT